MSTHPQRSLRWVGPAKRELLDFPLEVRQVMGYAIYLAQIGEKHPDTKRLHEEEFGLSQRKGKKG